MSTCKHIHILEQSAHAHISQICHVLVLQQEIRAEWYDGRCERVLHCAWRQLLQLGLIFKEMFARLWQGLIAMVQAQAFHHLFLD